MDGYWTFLSKSGYETSIRMYEFTVKLFAKSFQQLLRDTFGYKKCFPVHHANHTTSNPSFVINVFWKKNDNPHLKCSFFVTLQRFKDSLEIIPQIKTETPFT